MKPLRDIRTKIVSPAELDKKQKPGQKMVFTNGCFDLLHPGHISYLIRAKKLGDILVVALNTDQSVARLKGPTRPIRPLKDRLYLMAALECVDFVTWFSEDTPLHLINKLKPKVLVKGGDYKIANVVGASQVQSWGGKVKILKFLEGHSTTNLVKKLTK